MNTIYELPFSLFSRAHHLFTDIGYDQACYDSVFEGKQPARLFVDQPDMPTAALMCRTYEYYVAGAVGTPLRTFIKDAPTEVDVFGHFYGYVALNSAWDTALREDMALEVIERQNFQWQGGKPAPDWQAGLPTDARIVPIDRGLAEQIDQHSPIPFIQYFWSGYDRYSAHGFGFALMVGDSIASTMYAISNSRRESIISVDTEQIYRRKGFAYLLGARYIDHCLQTGLLPVWDCDRINKPSANLAHKLGFVERQAFTELAFPDRAKPPMTTGIWSRGEGRADAVVVWTRSG